MDTPVKTIDLNEEDWNARKKAVVRNLKNDERILRALDELEVISQEVEDNRTVVTTLKVNGQEIVLRDDFMG